uniref:Peptidase M1 leukotriene A4 hydrolase/aminopeptidase C-terminal domain-containing protein n=1 Tax=Chrysotila carterae TaxID=13221 RepID=A0A7S4EYR6_CHRCT
MASALADPCSQASECAFRCSRLQLLWHVDFERKVLRGCAEWTVQRSDGYALTGDSKPKDVDDATVVLDTKALKIEAVRVEGKPATFSLCDEHHVFGQALKISLRPAGQGDGPFQVSIDYETSPESSACQWLSAELTAGKEHPYLFTQCQAIHGRALLPCQDSPGAKFSYEASVTVPEWATALMSARRGAAPAAAAKPPDASTRVFAFHQPVPVPAYLFAIAVGHLASREVGPRSLVWSEPSMVDEVAHEFAEVESFLQAAEEITGQPYIWGQYDLLCLPPSFPYGGMENPCLTFLTPTLIAGDRSLAGVVAHEVSHSWTGNLLTNHTWEHFWLNEGWTVWLERRIEAKMHGETWYAFSSLEANDSLQEAVSRYGDSHNFTKLVPTLRDIDPDDAFSCIPYEKGFQFIHFLGEVIGSKAFPEYVTAYIGEFKMKTLTSDEFKAFTISWCGGRGVDLSAVDWDEWLHAPGMPPVRLSLANVEGERAKELAAQWLRPQSEMDPSGCPEGAAAGAPQGWRHQHWLVFFGCLSSEIDSEPSHALSLERLLRMDEAYGFSASRNAEVVTHHREGRASLSASLALTRIAQHRCVAVAGRHERESNAVITMWGIFAWRHFRNMY